MDNLTKNTGLSKDEIEKLRTSFIIKYCNEAGWDPKNLTTEQLLTIQMQKEYQTPGLILS